MLTSKRSVLVSLLMFVLIAALLVCSMSVAVFAHDDDDSSSSTKKSAWDKFVDWFDGTAGQIVGYVVAGVLFAVCVGFIVWWIPKNDKKDVKKSKK